MEFTVSDDFYRKHFLMGVLLREVESCLQYELVLSEERLLEYSEIY